MRAMYPGGGFVVIGEIGNFAQIHEDHDVLLTDDEKEIPIFPRGSLIKYFEWISGYIAVEKNAYAAAVKSIFPAFLRSRKQRL
jgi:phospholipase/carboxylesterase